MKITNRHNLPGPVIRSLEADPYDGPGPHGREISVSQLCGPPQIRQLMAEHEADLEQDASDMLHALLGTAFHAVLERGAGREDIVEHRFATREAGWEISGKPDRYVPSESLLQDWKTTSAWKVILGGNEDWERQLNLYALILERNLRPVKKLEGVAFLKDLSEVKKTAKNKRTLPATDIIVVDIPLWTVEKREKYLLERIRAHEAALAGPVRCDQNDTWRGKRCEKYCPVRHFCPQIQPDQLFDVDVPTKTR